MSGGIGQYGPLFLLIIVYGGERGDGKKHAADHAKE